MAIDPSALASEVARDAHKVEPEPPTLLRHPPAALGPLPPLRGSEAIEALHRRWATLETSAATGRTRRVVLAVLRRTAHYVAGRGAGGRRQLVAELIQVSDVLAARCDELADRIVRLDDLLAEVVAVTSEDLAQLRAAATRRGSGDHTSEAVDASPDTRVG